MRNWLSLLFFRGLSWLKRFQSLPWSLDMEMSRAGVTHSLEMTGIVVLRVIWEGEDSSCMSAAVVIGLVGVMLVVM